MQTPIVELPEGTLIGDRYKLLKSMGHGGFGITYRAWDKQLKRQVVVKECFPFGICQREPSTGAIVPMHPQYENAYVAALDDMRREVHTLAKLNHENVVRVYDVIWGFGGVFCVMPWLPGGTLKERMLMGDLTPENTLRYLRCLLDALAYLHEHGVIHRDLKPENIMFDEADRPVIIDFGAALNRQADTLSATSQGAFSPRYAAPEQVSGKGKIGPWTDFYSLSATWYELLTGIQPESASARFMEDDLPPLSDACRMRYPSELLKLLQTNLSLRPECRCKSVAQWLECWESGTVPPLPIPKSGGWLRSHLLLIVAVAAAVVAVGAAGVVMLKPAEQSGSGEQGPSVSPAEAKIPLREKLSKACRLDEFTAMVDAYCDEYDALLAAYQKKQDVFYAAAEKELEQLRTVAELKAFMSKFDKEEHAATTDWRNRANKLTSQFYKNYNEFHLDGSGEIAAHYEPTDMVEAALLTSVADELWNNIVYPGYNKGTMKAIKAAEEQPKRLDKFQDRIHRKMKNLMEDN